MEEIKSQEGPQTAFLASSADIVLYGGAAGGGKSYGLLLEPLRHINNKGFGGVIFRRTTPQIRAEGALWDTSEHIYPFVGASPRQTTLDWNFKSGATISFDHLEYEKTIYNWQGSQIAFIGFDELTHFTKKQFFYMLSRNRSTCGVRPYVRATTNPQSVGWVREMIDWWIGPDGLPDVSKGGIIRWFINDGGKIHWFSSQVEAETKFSHIPAKSFTFIPATVHDNKILLEKDPSYLANLYALPEYERDQLLGGNWDTLAGENRIIHAFDHTKHMGDFNPRGNPKHCGLDFNVNPLCGVVLEYVNGVFYIFDEMHLGTKEKGSDTFKASDWLMRKHGRLQIAPDSTGNQRRTSSKTTDHQILRDAGHIVMQTHNPHVVDLYNNINRLFALNRIKIHNRCVWTKKYLMGLTADNEKDFDHIVKALGYILWKLDPYRQNGFTIKSGGY